jgi:hypothetical protein
VHRREQFLAVRKSGAQKWETEERGCDFLEGVKLVKLDWETEKAVARHMTHGATDAESGVRDCLKQCPI